jgi:hypothetical protein
MSGWPDGVKKITVADLNRLGINNNQELFWDGKRVEIRRALSLTRFQKILTAIVSTCAILGGLGGAVTGFNNLTVFLCARGIDRLSCPLPQQLPR